MLSLDVRTRAISIVPSVHACAWCLRVDLLVAIQTEFLYTMVHCDICCTSVRILEAPLGFVCESSWKLAPPASEPNNEAWFYQSRLKYIAASVAECSSRFYCNLQSPSLTAQASTISLKQQEQSRWNRIIGGRSGMM